MYVEMYGNNDSQVFCSTHFKDNKSCILTKEEKEYMWKRIEVNNIISILYSNQP